MVGGPYDDRIFGEAQLVQCVHEHHEVGIHKLDQVAVKVQELLPLCDIEFELAITEVLKPLLSLRQWRII